MSRAYDHHRPCPCGAELADECPSCARTNPLGSMQLHAPGDRTGWRPSGTALLRISESADEPMITGGLDPNQRDWWSNNHEAWLPSDPEERAEHLTQLAHEREHGPAAGEETP